MQSAAISLYKLQLSFRVWVKPRTFTYTLALLQNTLLQAQLALVGSPFRFISCDPSIAPSWKFYHE